MNKALSTASGRAKLKQARTATADAKENGPLMKDFKSLSKGGPFPSTKADPAEKKESTATQIDSLLGSLTPAERKQLLDKLALEVNSESTAGRDLDMWAAGVAAAFVRVLPGNGYGELLIKKKLGERAYWNPVKAFVACAGIDSAKVTERQAFYNLLGKILVTECHRISVHSGFPCTLNFVAGQTANLASCFEAQFPGYVANRMVPFLLKRLTSGTVT